MTPQQASISQRLRDLTQELRRTPKPLAEIIPLLNAAADELDRRAPAPTEPAVDRDSAHYARLTLIRASGDEALIEAVKVGKVSIRAALLQVLCIAPASPVAEPAVDRDAVLKLKRWTFDGGMSAAIRADGQWVYFDDVLRLATPASPAVPARQLHAEWVLRQIAQLTPGQSNATAIFMAKEGLAAMQAVPAPAPLAPIPDVLFDGMAVYEEIKRAGGHMRTSAENVSEVLDAIVRLLRASQPTSTPEAVNLLVEEAKRVMGQG